MQVVSRATDLVTRDLPVSVAIGMFDGVHLGHQRLLQLALHNARQQQGLAVAVTFDRHPNTVIAPDRAPPSLQTTRHRLTLLKALGIDAVVLIPFDELFSRLPADAFIRDLSHNLRRISTLCVGQGFTFGHRRAGNVALLQSLGRELGYTTHELPAVCLDGLPIRSTRIRELVAAGELTTAASLLGRPYSVAGKVVHGDHLGRQLGFPTANVDLDGLALPPNGVYAARAVLDQKPHPAVLNIGMRPTLNHPEPRLRFEVHLLEFDGNLYGKTLDTIVQTRLRPEQHFDSLEALRRQIQQDIAAVSDALT